MPRLIVVYRFLCRRAKNNPLFVGEPGVGKTALANGIAQLLINDKVPNMLQGNTVYFIGYGGYVSRHQVPW